MALRRTNEERRGTPSVLLIVGLANPGSEYEGSRHNIGGDAVREVANRRRANFSVERRQRASTATITTPRGPVTLAIPTTYMNESGASIGPLLKRTSISDLTNLVVAHDELDLEPQRLQLKFGGGLAGHNGLRSIAKTLGTQDFSRLRIGIGKPERKEMVTDWVLKRPTGSRKESLANDIERAADALELLIDHGLESAQRSVNGS
jgi:peptidyl-tRNA hydrolase, PTH1 family